MDRDARPNDPPAKSLAQALVPETNAKYGYVAGKTADYRERNASLAWRARAGGDNNLLRAEFSYLLTGDTLVAKHPHVCTEFAKVLH